MSFKAKSVDQLTRLGCRFALTVAASAGLFLLPTGDASAADKTTLQVVASIKPIHSLVASVMKGAGEPVLIVKGAASPHGYSLRPSEAKALSQADLIFWVDADLESFLGNSLESLAGDAKIVTLMETQGLSLLPYREGGDFAGHVHGDHGDHEGHDDAHQGEEKEEHHDEAHHEEEEHHDDAHHDEKGHSDEGEMDAHLWLDPHNAEIMVKAIAEELAAKDPAHAALYRENAARVQQTIADMSAELAQDLAAVQSKPFIVFHDGYQYFESRFGLQAIGSVTGNPDVQPGAKRVRDLQEKMKAQGVTCIFSEPQFDDRRVAIVSQGTNAKIGELDPLGASFKPGPDLYEQVIRQIASAAADCLG